MKLPIDGGAPDEYRPARLSRVFSGKAVGCGSKGALIMSTVRRPIRYVLGVVLAVAVGVGCQSNAATEGRALTEQEVEDLLVGSCIQATRGCDASGYIEEALAAMEEGLTFRLVSLDSIPEDWRVVAPGVVGGGGAWEHVTDRAEELQLPTYEDWIVRAIATLSEFIEDDFDAVIRAEPAGATLAALMSSAQMELPLVDACMSGRARPEITQQIPWVEGIPSTPTALYTRWGDEVIVKKAANDYRSEDLARGVAVASGGGAAIALNPMTGAEAHRGMIADNLSQAIRWGQTVREAQEAGKNPIEALVAEAEGYELFRGIVTKSDSRGERGFTWVDVTLEGTGRYDGHTYDVFVKNENIISWLDGEVDVMSPDFILNLDPETGHAVTGGGLGGYPVGDTVAMVGVPAPPEWRSERGIELLGPRHFDFDFDYRTIEELQSERASTIAG